MEARIMSNQRNETAATALQRRAAKDTAIQTESELSYPPPSTVKGYVLGDLLAGRTITHKDTWIEHGSSRLAHHIHILRRTGWPVVMVKREVTTTDSGRTAKIGVYSLPRESIDEAGERGQQFVEAARAEKECVR
jgi:hypothetical protein